MTSDSLLNITPEAERLIENDRRERFWELWGPYLAERQWGTVREDYTKNGDVWGAVTHATARSRAYRWGEDGLLGFTDRFNRLCFGLALWNGKDEILKERLFGLTGPQGNHGEDVKELYYYLDSTPTHSYCKALYKYPQAAFPYERLIRENAARSRTEGEFELIDTGVFDGGRYFDVFVEYAKGCEEDVAIRVTIANRGPEDADIHLLPNFWFRNTWSWGAIEEECVERPGIEISGRGGFIAEHATLGRYYLDCGRGPDGVVPDFLFTENETNTEKLYGVPNKEPFVKDAFHEYVVNGVSGAVNPSSRGTKAAAHYKLHVPAGQSVTIKMRLALEHQLADRPLGKEFDDLFATRIAEADGFYAERIARSATADERRIARQGYAGLLWSKQFYYLVQTEWWKGDPAGPPPPDGRLPRNDDWKHLFSRDILSMPDKWEYPYFCTWDSAFHAVSMCRIDPGNAKRQLLVFLREWYMHPNGQMPAYEWNFCDVNPPVHPWGCWRVFRLPWLGRPDYDFLERVFQKLLLNFTWWVNRKDPEDNNLFGGGFLGLDNIGVFDRSQPLPTGGTLKQADGTAWMGFYSLMMLTMALELAQKNKVYEDLASKFFEHFVRIVHAINEIGGKGLWDEQDGFYYDLLEVHGNHVPLRVRSIVGFIPLFATTILPSSYVKKLPDFAGRMQWFVENRPLLTAHLKELNPDGDAAQRLLSIVSREQLVRMLRYMFDEKEFLSPYGIRSVSKFHEEHPYTYWCGDQAYSVDYEPGEGKTGMFGGNSNWRGPVWFPINYLLIESLRTYHRFYGDSLLVEFPTGSGNHITLGDAAQQLSRRLISLFLPDENGSRPCHGGVRHYTDDPHFKDLLLFNEYYHAETGRGLGASHQTGWTALVTDLLNLQGK